MTDHETECAVVESERHGHGARAGIKHPAERHETPAAMRWDATTTVVLAPVGEYLLPVKISFEHAFGRDWEPETIVFKDVRVRVR